MQKHLQKKLCKNSMQNMGNSWEHAICNKYAKCAKYVNQNVICRICTPHFADVHFALGELNMP